MVVSAAIAMAAMGGVPLADGGFLGQLLFGGGASSSGRLSYSANSRHITARIGLL